MMDHIAFWIFLFAWIAVFYITWKFSQPIPTPGRVGLVVVKESGDMLDFKLTLPPVPSDAPDIVGGKLVYQIGDGEPVTVPTALDQTEVIGLEGAQGDTVSGTYQHFDDADPPNYSEPTPFSYVLRDTIAPPAPGVVGLVVTGER